MLSVKVGKGCCFFQGLLVLKSLQIQICFYEVAVGPFVAFICKAGAVADKMPDVTLGSSKQLPEL